MTIKILKPIFEHLRNNKQISFDWKKFKIKASPKLRKLKAGWTVEAVQDLQSMYSLDLEQEMADALKEEIDKEILQSIITEEDMSKQVIGICGLIGSGKDTVGQLLVDEYDFTKVSFAGTLKDMTAVLFDWDRDMLEGTTPETRAEREVTDEWWTKKLGREWSPRIALQQMGTEVIRNHLHQDMWIHTVENKIRKLDKVVITDCRFANEIDFVKKHGDIWVVDRGKKPSWWEYAVAFNNPSSPDTQRLMHDAGRTPSQLGVHASEYSWAGVNATNTIDNNGSIEGLYARVRSLV